GVEELIHQVLLKPDVPAQHVHQEHFGKLRLLAEHAHQCCFFQPHDRAFRHRAGACHAPWLSRQTSFAEKIAGAQERDYGLLSLAGNHSQLYPSLLNVEHGIRRIALCEYRLAFDVYCDAPPPADFGQEAVRIEATGKLRFGFSSGHLSRRMHVQSSTSSETEAKERQPGVPTGLPAPNLREIVSSIDQVEDGTAAYTNHGSNVCPHERVPRRPAPKMKPRNKAQFNAKTFLAKAGA